MRLLTLIFIASLLMLASCYKDAVIKNEKVIIKKDHPSIPSNSAIVGALMNEYGTTISNYAYEFDNDNIDVEDYSFYFDLPNSDQNGTTVTVNHKYEKAEFTLKPIDGELNYIQHCVFTQLEPSIKPSTDQHEVIFQDGSCFKFIC